MAEPITIAKISAYSAGFIKKYWHIILILLFIVIAIPFLMFSIVLNILFPQVDREGFTLYKSLTEQSEINWTSFMAYDVVRLDNYLRENRPNESVFYLLKISFTEYEIIETEKEVTRIVDGKPVTEVVTQKEYRVVRELELQGYSSIKELLGSLDYDTSEDNMTVNNVTDFLNGLNEKEEYEIETVILSDEEISEGFDEKHKVILFFGAIRPYKGLDTLIRAFSIVQKAVPEARLLIAGKLWESRQLYNDLIQSREITDYVLGKGSLVEAPFINWKSLKKKGLTENDLIKAEESLKNAFDINMAFNQFTLGEETLENLGIVLDEKKNTAKPGEGLISSTASKVKVAVVPTNEELIVAREVAKEINK